MALDGGERLSLDALIGKPMVVVFWSPPCRHCQEEMPKIDALAARLHGTVNFMSAAIETPDVPAVDGYRTPAEAVTTMRITMPSVAMSRSAADAAWGPSELPTAYVLDKDHKIVQVVQSADSDAISNALTSVGITN